MIDREPLFILSAIAAMTIFAVAISMCHGCAVAQQKPEPYKATLRIWKCGKLIEETITELEVEENEIPSANRPCGPTPDK